MQRDDRLGPAPPSGADGRTRRAGWLAVTATCAFLVAIMIITTRLAETDERILVDGFPGPPTGGLLTADPPGPQRSPAVTEPVPNGDAVVERTAGPDAEPVARGADGGAREVDSVDPPDGGPGEPPAARPPRTTAAQPGAASPPRPAPTTPPTSSDPPTQSPGAASDALVTATYTFYDLLPHDVAGAWNRVGGSVRDRGYDAFAALWAGVDEVVVLDVRPDATTGRVLVTLTVTRDKQTTTEQHELMFRDDRGKLVVEQLSKPTSSGYGHTR